MTTKRVRYYVYLCPGWEASDCPPFISNTAPSFTSPPGARLFAFEVDLPILGGDPIQAGPVTEEGAPK